MLQLFGSKNATAQRNNTSQPPANNQQAQPPANQQRGGAMSPVGGAIKGAIAKTMGEIGAIAMPPILVGLIVTILLFICAWIISQTIVQLFGIHRQFLVVCLSLLIGAILGGAARLAWGMSGVAVSLGKALSNLVATAESTNYDREVIYPRLLFIGAVGALFTFITLFAFSILGGSAYYITAQKTSSNIFAFNSDEMLNTAGTTFNQQEFEDRSISLLPQTGAGKAISGMNSAGIKSKTSVKGSAYTVAKGETFGSIAKKHNIDANLLKDANPTHARQKWLKVGDVLVIPN